MAFIASNSDVQVACEKLGQRGLENCRVRSSPAYISCEDSALAIITDMPLAGSPLADLRVAEPKRIHLPPPPGMSVSGEDKVQDQQFYGYFEPAESWSMVSAPGDWPAELHEYDSPSCEVYWDWKTGRIIPRGQTSQDFESKNSAQPLQTDQAWYEDGKDSKDGRRMRRRHSQLIMATSLCALADKDTHCVIYARQIQKLGFESAAILREYFEQYGPVEDVLLSNAHNRTKAVPFSVRIRPSGIGLIVMRNKDHAAAALAAGETHFVKGSPIRIRKFEARNEQQEDEINCVEVEEVVGVSKCEESKIAGIDRDRHPSDMSTICASTDGDVDCCSEDSS